MKKNPLRVKAYHGSNSVFDKFDQRKARIINDFFGGGIAYFTENTKVAITYAQNMARKSGKPVVYEVNLNFRNLFDVDQTFTGNELKKIVEKDNAEDFARGAGLLTARADKYDVIAKLKDGSYKLSGEQIFRGLSRGMNQTKKARDILIELGFDGLRYNGGVNMGMATKHSVYLAYDANSITILNKYGLKPKGKDMTEKEENIDKKEKKPKGKRTDTGEVPGEIEINPEEKGVNEEEQLDEISVQQRLRRRNVMRRMQPRLRVARRRAERRGATQDVVRRRAQRRARSAVKKRLSGNRAVTGAADKKRIERMADKRKAVITRLARQKRQDVRRDASKRRTRREDIDLQFNQFILSESLNLEDRDGSMKTLNYIYDTVMEERS